MFCEAYKMEEMENKYSNSVRKVSLRSITPEMSNVFLIGIIIAKQIPRTFDSSERKRGVWNFTFRDSVRDYINVTFWGDASTVIQMNIKFQIGDIGSYKLPLGNTYLYKSISFSWNHQTYSDVKKTGRQRRTVQTYGDLSIQHNPLGTVAIVATWRPQPEPLR